jgi:multiple sugar transport system substrate-binding protein
MQARTILLAAALVLAPLTGRGADLTIWWNKGFYPEEDEAIRRVAADFAAEAGIGVTLDLFPQIELGAKLLATLSADRPPDVAISVGVYDGRWAAEGLLLDLSDIIGPIESRYAPASLDYVRHLDHRTGRPGYYGLPIAQLTYHIHAWKSLLDQVGIGLDQAPKEWDAFWDFWCDTVQPAVRRATRRRNLFGLGLPVSTAGTVETAELFTMFLLAHDAYFVSPDGRLLFEEPGMRERIVRALESFTRPTRRGAAAPGAVAWTLADNNVNFLNQIIVMTANGTLVIPGSQRSSDPDNYYKNIATLEWPDAVGGGPMTHLVEQIHALAFRGGRNPAGAAAFLRYLTDPEHLGPYLEAAQGRWFPPMPALAERPFWTDPADPHRNASWRQLVAHATKPSPRAYDRRYERVDVELVWPRAIGRVTVEGWSAEAAADEAIARTKQLMEQR